MANIQQVKENLAILNERNQALLDLANTTTGNNDTNLTDGVNALVSGYGQGGGIQLPEDMLEGLENGYDIMFYDENNVGLAFYSIRQGDSINPPIYSVKVWQKSNGDNITFPYTPTEDTIFYAYRGSYASQLYDHFGIDEVTYPYLAIFDGMIVYANSVTKESDTKIALRNGAFCKGSTLGVDLSETNTEILINNLLQSTATWGTSSYKIAEITTTSTNVHLNFNPSNFGVAINYVDLNQ